MKVSQSLRLCVRNCTYGIPWNTSLYDPLVFVGTRPICCSPLCSNNNRLTWATTNSNVRTWQISGQRSSLCLPFSQPVCPPNDTRGVLLLPFARIVTDNRTSHQGHLWLLTSRVQTGFDSDGLSNREEEEEGGGATWLCRLRGGCRTYEGHTLTV